MKFKLTPSNTSKPNPTPPSKLLLFFTTQKDPSMFMIQNDGNQWFSKLPNSEKLIIPTFLAQIALKSHPIWDKINGSWFHHTSNHIATSHMINSPWSLFVFFLLVSKTLFPFVVFFFCLYVTRQKLTPIIMYDKQKKQVIPALVAI